MKLLLDTHIFLWWIADDPRLPAAAQQALGDGTNCTYVSVASIWEIGIKAGLGRLLLPEPATDFMAEQLRVNGFTLLPISLAHALHIVQLPSHHRDPFDRLLIAQAKLDGLRLVTCDAAFAAFGIDLL